MRIISGLWRGRKLAVPDTGTVRPTSDRVREALFDILAHAPDCRFEGGPLPAGAAVLDVFAGTGAHGLEALSRGARHAVFMEKDAAGAALIRRQLRALDAEDRATVIQRDAAHPGPVGGDRAALAILDPPYGSGLAAPVLEALGAAGWLLDGALAVIETDFREDVPVPEGFSLIDVRRYGRSKLTFLRRGGA